MRELAIALLEDEHGISNHAFKVLSILLSSMDEDDAFDDILDAAKSTDGRWHLPEGWDNVKGKKSKS